MAAARKRTTAPAASTSLDDVQEMIEVKAGLFKDTCLQLLDQVHDRKIQVVVTKRGEPIAKIVPPGPHASSAFGFMRGTLLAHEDIVSPDFEASDLE